MSRRVSGGKSSGLSGKALVNSLVFTLSIVSSVRHEAKQMGVDVMKAMKLRPLVL